MDIKEYIESGILEAYVFGALPEVERAQVEADMALYPELAAEVQAMEASMLMLAEATAVQPPAHLQNQIWAAISGEAPVEVPAQHVSTDSPSSPKSIPLPATPVSRPAWQRAAVWAALIGSVLLNFVLMSQRNQMADSQTAMQQQLDTLRQQQQHLAGMLNDYRKEGEIMADSNVQTIVMKSIQPGHTMAATIYWNKAKGETYLSMKKLPMPPQGMQYQMWVIQEGKPVSMGVISNDMVDKDIMAPLPMSVTDGQAFAISLEKEGGSPTPTAENIYVLGKPS